MGYHPVPHDQDRVAQPDRLLDGVGSDDDRHATIGQIADDLVDLFLCADIEAARGMVEEWAGDSGGRLERLSEQLGPANLRRFTWDAPCHQCHGQQIRESPLALLDAIPGSERVELRSAESCCGSAGIYSLLRPADAAALLRPKLAELRESGARTLITANPGCQLQWASGVHSSGLDVRVMHLAEALESSLEGIKDGPGAVR